MCFTGFDNKSESFKKINTLLKSIILEFGKIQSFFEEI